MKYDKPKDIWNIARITADNALIKEYGLKNMRELWKIQSELSRIRGNIRLLLSGSAKQEGTEDAIKNRLIRLGVASKDTQFEALLELKENSLLDRRLQSVVYKRGMARSMKQARQLITHGFISINGIKVNIPGYLVQASEESKIGYYKPIEIVQQKAEQPAAPVPEGSAQGAETAAAE